ncbi:MAG: PKD domain-containing protein [Candidatus Bathyarchaeota archaeon]|nr:PKD domain-containing protein [Candidatus Bathyarchaeota archaeon]
MVSNFFTITLIALLVTAPILFITANAAPGEPTIEEVLNTLGFTNITEIDAQTFPAGSYNITLYAEFAGYHSLNQLDYYAVNTTNYQTIFTGPVGATGDQGGYVVPPVSTIFTPGCEFGLSMLAPSYRYFTEHYLNPDYPLHHAIVYRNLNNPAMYLIGFENFYGDSERDYNDMVFSLVPIQPPQIVSVTRDPLTPDVNEAVTVSATVTKGTADIASVILGYQVGSGSWNNLTMSLASGSYVATIPGQAAWTTVNYKVYATDAVGLSDVSAVYSYTVNVVGPSIVSVTRLPVNPDYDQTVTVSANVTKGSVDIDSVILEYQIGSGSKVNVTMNLNSGLYVANIPAQTAGVTVNYKVYANDTLGLSDVSSVFSYTVSVVPPTIVSVARSPLTPNFDQSVTVKAEVVKGVADITSVILGYQAGSAGWVNVTMNLSGGRYVAAIPAYTFGTTVNYRVYATDAAGLSDVSAVFTYKVNANRAPYAAFTESATTVYIGEVIDFDASGSYDVDGTIVSYTWIFGDGKTATGVTTSHVFTAKGPYSVSLKVVDNYGASSMLTKGFYVTNMPPVAILNASSTIVDSKEVVSFTAIASYDLDGTIVSYEWDFGDFTKGTGMNVTHTFPRGGEYIVKLTVTDNDGATGTAIYPKIIANIPPVAIIDQSSESVYPDDTVTFNAANSFDPDGSIVAYEWDFGDGTTATGTVVSHVYSNKGTIIVTLTVTDNNAATGTASSTVTVMNIAPNAAFTASANTAKTEQTISFDASRSSDPDGTIVNYLWDFGDGTTATGVEVTHAYGQTGTFTVTLTVTDNDGAADSTSETKTVTNQPPVAVISETQTTINNGEAAQLDASESYDADGTITSYLWDFGDGTTATTVEAEHTYESTGEYTVTLTVTDNDGATDSVTTTIVVNSPPEAIFTQSSTTPTQGEAVSFDASESYDTDGTIVSYEWDFGDGTTATGIEVEHTFTQAGEYTVTLTVTDNNGATDSTTANTSVQDAVVSLAIIGFVVLGVTAITLTLLYGLFIRRRKKKQNNQ